MHTIKTIPYFTKTLKIHMGGKVASSTNGATKFVYGKMFILTNFRKTPMKFTKSPVRIAITSK